MFIFLLLGVFLIVSGILILLKKEIKMSPLFLINDLFSWILIKMARSGQPEPVYSIKGVPRVIIGLLVLFGGFALCYYYFFLSSLR